jgi:prephenate dehydrogenase
MQHVAIVGTGLIGASFGLALKQHGFTGTITGVSSPRAIEDAIAAGAIDRGAPLADALPEADLVFLSQTIGRILDTLRHIDPLLKPGALVTDAGSTKCEIVDIARQHITRAQFLGGHPMAGKEKRGAGAADGTLFRNRTWVLTPDVPAELATPIAREFRSWLDRIGAHLLTWIATSTIALSPSPRTWPNSPPPRSPPRSMNGSARRPACRPRARASKT